jgi:hypothetical protein
MVRSFVACSCLIAALPIAEAWADTSDAASEARTPGDTPKSRSEQLRAVTDQTASASSRVTVEPIRWLPVVIEPMALFVAMRGTEAYLWPNPFSFRRTSEWPARYRDAFTQWPKFDSHRGFMEWDGDHWKINVIGHGLLGSELYLRPRRCGVGWLGSLAIAAGTSALWEFGIEANGVRPSAVDLVYTPISGLVLGELRFWAWQATGSLSDSTWRTVLRSLVDPVGEFGRVTFDSPC